MNWGHSVQLEQAVLTLERLFLHLKYTWNTRFKSAHHAMDVSPIVRLDQNLLTYHESFCSRHLDQ